MVKNLPAHAGDAGDAGLISGSGRSSREGNDKSAPVFLLGKFHGKFQPHSLASVVMYGCESSILNKAEH